MILVIPATHTHAWNAHFTKLKHKIKEEIVLEEV